MKFKKQYCTKPVARWFRLYKEAGSPKRLIGDLLDELFAVHNSIFLVQEKNKSCPTCVNRVFKDLKQIYKAEYE